MTTPLPYEKHIPFPVHKDYELDLTSLEKYLNTAPIASRQALFRDIQFHYVLQDEPLLRKLVMESMKNMGLLMKQIDYPNIFKIKLSCN